jgi:hypothetical protein
MTPELAAVPCQWKELPIEKDANGRQEIHYTRVWRAFHWHPKYSCFNM